MSLHLENFLAEGETECGCGGKDKTCPVARAILGRAIGHLNPTVTLYYRERDDCLSEEQLDQIFNSGNLEQVQEQIDDWFFETVHYSVDYEIEELVDNDCKALLDEHDLLNDLEEEIRERDDSDPFGELAAATNSVWLAHPANYEVEEGANPSEEVERICQHLQIANTPANTAALRSLLTEWELYGDLEVAWESELVNVCEKFYWQRDPEEKRDDLLLRVQDASVGIDDYWVVLNGPVTVPLKVDFVRYIRRGDQPQDQGEQPVEVLTELDAYRQQLERFILYRQQLLESSNGTS